MELSTIMVTTLCEMSSSFRLEEGKKSCPFPLAQKRLSTKITGHFPIFFDLLYKSPSRSAINQYYIVLCFYSCQISKKIFGEIFLEEYNIPAVGLHLE